MTVHGWSEDGPVTVGPLLITTPLIAWVSDAPVESITAITTLYVPVAVGVPEMTPVLVLIDSPVGRPVAFQATGVVPPFRVGVIVGYGRPTVHDGRDVGAVMVGRALMVTR